MSSIEVVLIATSGPPTPSTPWYQVVSGILAIPATFATVLFGYIAARKTRLESAALRRSAKNETDEQGVQQPLSKEARIRESLSVGSSDYIRRFIIFFLVGEVTTLLLQAVTAAFAGISNTLNLTSSSEQARNWAFGLSYGSSLFALGIEILVFAILGWPLLSDILRDVGLTPRKLFSRKAFEVESVS